MWPVAHARNRVFHESNEYRASRQIVEAAASAQKATEAAALAAQRQKDALASAELAKEQTRLAVRSAYVSDVSLAYQLWRAGDVKSARQLLARCPVELRLWEWHYLDLLCRAALHTFDTLSGLGVAPRPDTAPTVSTGPGVYLAAAGVLLLVAGAVTAAGLTRLPRPVPAPRAPVEPMTVPVATDFVL